MRTHYDGVCYAVHMGKDFRWWMVPLALFIVIIVLWALLSFDSSRVLPHEYDVIHRNNETDMVMRRQQCVYGKRCYGLVD